MDGVDSNRWSKPNVESNSLWQVGKNYLIPWSVHLVWMSFPCLTPLTHRSVPWWFNSLKRGSFHRIYSSFTHHLLIIYSSFTCGSLFTLLVSWEGDPSSHHQWGPFFCGQAHDSPWWWRIWPCAPGSRRASLKWDYRRLHASADEMTALGSMIQYDPW